MSIENGVVLYDASGKEKEDAVKLFPFHPADWIRIQNNSYFCKLIRNENDNVSI
jgi:hypothetical protein